MLAQSFKTAKQLKISDEQWIALQKTLVLFEIGKVEFVDVRKRKYKGEARDHKIGKFNMSEWRTSYHGCGTVSCIGGTAEAIGNCKFSYKYNTDEYNEGPLHDLFFPHMVLDWDEISVECAAKALRNYLTLGKPMWEKVMPKELILD